MNSLYLHVTKNHNSKGDKYIHCAQETRFVKDIKLFFILSLTFWQTKQEHKLTVDNKNS